MNADLREILAELEEEGWKFTRTSKGHWRGVHPDSPQVLIVSGTSSDWRAVANARATARRLVS
jgi:predicted RNA binding protein YcfA (HicA-like mRNA interferase family)